MNHHRSERGFTLIEGCVVFLILGIILSAVIVFFLCWPRFIEPSVYRTDYILEMKSIADKSGSQDRIGYSDDICDSTETGWILIEMGLMKDTSLDDVSSRKIKQFVLDHRQN